MSTEPAPLLQSLIDCHDHPFVLIDRDYRIVAANKAYSAAYEAESTQLIGRHCYEVSHHRDSPCHLHGEDCPHRQVFATAAAHQVVHTHFDPLGRPEQVRIKGFAVRGAGDAMWLGESVLPLAGADEVGCHESGMVGRAPAFLDALDALARAANSDAGILLYGESGVGKDLAARYVHRHSARRSRRFQAIDCTTITEALFESEVFGHERGAFTGCVGRKAGLFELADGGTLFLDEIAEIPLAVQAKLLRVLETGEFRRLGGREALHADVRIVAATNRDLRRLVAEHRFREDLYYRLACVTVRIPALRERRGDILVLAEALLAQVNHRNGKRCRLSNDALEALLAYDFPGNVRELRNVLQRAVALSRGEVIGRDELGLELPDRPQRPAERDKRRDERESLRELLGRFGGNRRQVAEALGVSERTLYRKLRRYELS